MKVRCLARTTDVSPSGSMRCPHLVDFSDSSVAARDAASAARASAAADAATKAKHASTAVSPHSRPTRSAGATTPREATVQRGEGGSDPAEKSVRWRHMHAVVLALVAAGPTQPGPANAWKVAFQ